MYRIAFIELFFVMGSVLISFAIYGKEFILSFFIVFSGLVFVIVDRSAVNVDMENGFPFTYFLNWKNIL